MGKICDNIMGAVVCAERKVKFMLEWNTPQLSDGGWVRNIITATDNYGSDCSFANMYLLRKKYNTQICRYRDFVLRKYYGTGAREGYGFPIGRGDVGKALGVIAEDAAVSGQELRFAFLTDEQMSVLEEHMPGQFDYYTDSADSDYVYERRELADLSGRAFHKKKNHFSKFERSYPDYEYEQLGCGNCEDALMVAGTWYGEHAGEEDKAHQIEYDAIREALQNLEELELTGGIIYVKNRPIAMTVASYINQDVIDVHYEKVVGAYAENGGYAAINRLFAKNCEGAGWLNREEDMGIEGLRKAKMSYRPKLMVRKYSARRKK